MARPADADPIRVVRNCHEYHLSTASIGVPIGKGIIPRMMGQIALIPPIGIHHINLIIAVPITVERNLSSIGGPNRIGIARLIECQSCLIAAI